jgi:hypothetical protein
MDIGDIEAWGLFMSGHWIGSIRANDTWPFSECKTSYQIFKTFNRVV